MTTCENSFLSFSFDFFSFSPLSFTHATLVALFRSHFVFGYFFSLFLSSSVYLNHFWNNLLHLNVWCIDIYFSFLLFWLKKKKRKEKMKQKKNIFVIFLHLTTFFVYTLSVWLISKKTNLSGSHVIMNSEERCRERENNISYVHLIKIFLPKHENNDIFL